MQRAQLVRVPIVILALATAACGGASEGENPSAEADDSSAVTSSSGDDSQAQPANAGQAGPVTLESDPATAWVEVDGQRFEYSASDTDSYTCTIDADRLTISYQTADGHDLLIQGGDLGDGWILNLTFKSRDINNVTYGGTIPGSGSLGLGGGALSYEGPVQKVVDFDVVNATDVDARLAVNCATSGGDPTATVDGVDYVIPMSGAQSVTCAVSDDAIEVRINRLALEGTQLEINGSFDGTAWLGNVTVYTPEGNLTSTFGPDVDGPTVDGSTVTYAGTFTSDSGEAEGTVSVTCP